MFLGKSESSYKVIATKKFFDFHFGHILSFRDINAQFGL